MKILTWNVEYWNNYEKHEWLKKCRDILQNLIIENNIEIILLQEINPFKLFDIDYEIIEPYRYMRYLPEDKLIIYHELYNEIPKIYRKNPWGNTIIINKNHSKVENILEYSNSINYYGRNGFMCYSVDFYDIWKIVFINFYNKLNEGKYTMLNKSHFDIKQIINRNNNLIIFAGDFNIGSNNNDHIHRNRYYNLCNTLNEFFDISDGDPKYNKNTTYWYNYKTKNGLFLRNYFCFINKQQSVRRYFVNIPNENEWEIEGDYKRWNGISDHCPIIIEIIFNNTE
jgi:exonuclease III